MSTERNPKHFKDAKRAAKLFVKAVENYPKQPTQLSVSKFKSQVESLRDKLSVLADEWCVALLAELKEAQERAESESGAEESEPVVAVEDDEPESDDEDEESAEEVSDEGSEDEDGHYEDEDI